MLAVMRAAIRGECWLLIARRQRRIRPLNGDRLAVRRVRGDLFWDVSSIAVTSLRVRFAACDAARAFAFV
jgi:hypothetical protein